LSVLAGITSLDIINPKNSWLTLSKHSVDSELLGFAQTAAVPDGFIVEIRIETPGLSDLGFWKAARRQAPESVVSQSNDGRFKTFANEVLLIEDVKAIFDHFYQQFQLHPGFTWRSILDDFLQNVPDDSAPKMASFRYHLDPWKTTRFTCTKCGSESVGSELAGGERFEDGIQRDCPKCHEPVLFLVFETVDELADHPEALTPNERDDLAKRSDFLKKWQAESLTSPEQLPDVRAKKFTLFWDNDRDTEEIIIRTRSRVIWRQPLAYEHYDFFVDALKILKAKYGRALVDVIPTERAHLYLWGDRLSAPEICDAARRKLREEGS
jgi:hypothetical protein